MRDFVVIVRDVLCFALLQNIKRTKVSFRTGRPADRRLPARLAKVDFTGG